MGTTKQHWIRASEIGEFVYCGRAWWLGHVVGLEPAGRERRAAGTALHERHGRQLAFSGLLIWAGLALLIGAMLVYIIR